ncbi:DEAD/DEAH box helicase [Shewanella maritima]|uniref:DEAD/DEAH box helicase n=1 Tax=Shewanella maritima TaxID=2520507 RepID=UPI003736DDCD
MPFSEFCFPQALCQAIDEVGYVAATPIQQAVIPWVIQGEDILASAETGTGKTAAFALPLLTKLASDDFEQHSLKVLVMAPTRELVIQIHESFEKYAQYLSLKSVAVYGGASINPQRKSLASGVDILVATPGRLFDIIGQYGLDLSSVNHLVIDEADRMLDMGFVRDIEKVQSLVAKQHQTMMFSATYSSDVEALATRMLQSPKVVNVKRQSTANTITQKAYLLDKRRKAELLSELIGIHNWQQLLVFTSTKETAEYLIKELTLDGIKAAVFHGDKTQGARNKALAQFKAGELRVLVATDLAARGLDIEALPRVVNFELPEENEDYVHRIGRTGRAGKLGEAISFFSPQERNKLAEIEALIGQSIQVDVPKGYEAGAPLPARYRELVSEKPKKKASFKHAGKNKHSSSKGNGKVKAKPSRRGKYAKG